MARLAFTVGTRYLLKGQVYVVRERAAAEQIRAENLSFGGWVVAAEAELVACWERGELVFEARGRHTRQLPDQPIPTAYTLTDFQGLADPTDPRARRRYEEAWRKYRVLLPLLQRPPQERTRAAIRAYLASLPAAASPAAGRDVLSPAACSYRSVERWLRAFEESGWDIRALVALTAQLGGQGASRLAPAVEELIAQVLATGAAHPQLRTVEEVYLAVVNAIAQANRTQPSQQHLPLPSRMTIHRRVRAAGGVTILRRRSRSVAREQEQVEVGPRPSRILERVEADHTLLDLCVVDLDDRLPIGRPTLTLLRDRFSGVPVGFYVGFEPPSYQTVAQALLHSILPKPDAQALYGTQHGWPAYCYGVPELLAVDNGKEFAGHDLEDACAQLGILREQMPPHTPWWKGAIERHFRTTNTGLVHSLPGSTFTGLIERGTYNPARDACISLAAFWRILHIYVLDYYLQGWHDGVGGKPAKLWATSLAAGFLPTLPPSAEEVRILLYRREGRTIQRTGIDFENLRYQSPLLVPLRSQLPKGTSVPIKYNPADLSYLYVADPRPSGGWVRVPAVDLEYTQGLSLWKHRIIQDYVRRQKQAEVHIEDLAAAKAQIQQIVVAEFRLARRQQGRKQAARFLGLSAPAAAPAPPALPAPGTSAVLPDPGTRPPAALPPPAAPPTVAALWEPSASPPGWGSSYLPPTGSRLAK